jgi:hypothetical protein
MKTPNLWPRSSRSRTIECEFLSRGPAGKSIKVRESKPVTATLLKGFDSEVKTWWGFC